MSGPFLQNGAPPPGWGEPEPVAYARDTGGQRLPADVLAERILVGLREHFTEAGVELPARQYPAPGAPGAVAWDCEQVTVAASGIGWGAAPAAGTEESLQIGTTFGAMTLRHVVFEIAIVRKLPVGASLDDSDSTAALPDLDALTAAGRAHLLDMGVLSQAMARMFGPDPLVAIVPAGSRAQPGLVESRGPEDNYAAVTATVAVTLGETA